MSERLGDVLARLSTVHQLESVVGAMRGIAAARSREARERLDGIRACAGMIGAAIGEALMLDAPDSLDASDAPVEPGARVVVVLCAEQGFVGTFNEHVVEAAARLRTRATEYFVIGGRGLAVAAAHGLDAGWSAPMVTHADEVGPLADRITEALYERLESGRATRVAVLHAVPQAAGANALVRTSLLPFDFSRFAPPARHLPPLVTLPPRRLLARLAEEYVYTQLCEALMLSFAAENEARMRAMIAARTHVHDTLEHLSGDARRLRQEAITAEIIELAAGSLAAQGPRGAEGDPGSGAARPA